MSAYFFSLTKSALIGFTHLVPCITLPSHVPEVTRLKIGVRLFVVCRQLVEEGTSQFENGVIFLW